MPIYEYRCEECGKRSSALLPSFSSPDPACPHCGKPALKRLVSTFATVHSGDDGGDGFGGGRLGGGGDGFCGAHGAGGRFDGGAAAVYVVSAPTPFAPLSPSPPS